MNEFVSLHTSDEQSGIATLLLSRPPTNALTRQVYREIVSAAVDLDHRDDIYAVILFGGHEIFSAGDDMPELSTLSADEADIATRVCREAVDALAAIPKPTVAAITGYALGGGLTMSLAADWRVAGDNAKEALALGLIDEMVAPDGVYDAALAWAKRFLDYPPRVLAAAKAAFDL